jgi:hypothetical protein
MLQPCLQRAVDSRDEVQIWPLALHAAHALLRGAEGMTYGHSTLMDLYSKVLWNDRLQQCDFPAVRPSGV